MLQVSRKCISTADNKTVLLVSFFINGVSLSLLIWTEMLVAL